MSRSLFARLHRRYSPNAIDAPTRRDMLRATLAASAGLLISSGCANKSRGGGGAGRKVIVIGAGFSGLACAHELKAAGYDVQVIEARNRVGGRILSFNANNNNEYIKGKNIEGGGELIGSNHPTWVNYARQFQLEFLDVTEDEDAHAPVLLGGRVLNEAESEKLYEDMDKAYGALTEACAPVNADEPWNTENAAALDKKNMAEWLAEQKLDATTASAVRAELAADNAVALEMQSYLGNLTVVKGGGGETYWTESEVYRCKGGNQQLAFKLARAFGTDRIALNKPVSVIDVSGDKVKVGTADGAFHEADELVLAVPPSVWQKIQIKPALPQTLAPQMGTAVKYLAELKKQFWKDKKLSPDMMTDGDLSLSWHATDNQGDTPPAGMVIFSGGPSAEAVRRYATERRDEIYRQTMERLYPGYSDNFVQARFMNWPSDPWAMAGYSFPAPGQVTTVGPALHKGVGKIHFCGEHCSYKFVGYMEGALNSGVALARRLATRDGAIKA